MTDTPEIKRIRAALKAYDEAGYYDIPQRDELQDACSTNSIRRVLAHIDAQTAEIEKLKYESHDRLENGVLLLANIDAQAAEIAVLKNDLKTALQMLAGWCIAVDDNGASWDDWDEHYKDAMYRDGPLRGQLDATIAAMKEKS